MNIFNFIQENIGSIVAVIMLIVFIVALIKGEKTELVKEIVLSLVVKSEVKWGSGTGEIKYAEVVEGIYKRLPAIVIMFLSEKEIDKMIEDAVKYMKKHLEEEQGIELAKGE